MTIELDTTPAIPTLPIPSPRKHNRKTTFQSPSPSPTPSPIPSPHSPSSPWPLSHVSSRTSFTSLIRSLMAPFTKVKSAGDLVVPVCMAATAAGLLAFSAAYIRNIVGFLSAAASATATWLLLTPVIMIIAVIAAIYVATCFIPWTDDNAQQLAALPFRAELVDLCDESNAPRVAKWMKDVDATLAETLGTNTAATPSGRKTPRTPRTPRQRDLPPISASIDRLSSISGRSLVSLISAYQKAKVDNAKFICLAIKTPTNIDEMDAEADAEVDADDVDTTVALIFITIITDMDLLNYINSINDCVISLVQGFFGYLSLVGINWRPHHIRLGLIGFEWPFKGGIIYTRPKKKIQHYLDNLEDSSSRGLNADVALLKFIHLWNISQPTSEQCNVMLYPQFDSPTLRQACQAAGMATIPLPSTYVADLRASRGITWKKYQAKLRSKGKRIRENPFNENGGEREIVDGADLTEEKVNSVDTMWNNVASAHQSDHTATLIALNKSLIQSLASESALCHFLFLTLQKRLVTTSVMFNLSDETMTSDLAGADYAALDEIQTRLNRNINIYVVKMATVMKYALEHNYSFVDFGPTTAATKMSVGCEPVPLVGVLFATNVAIVLLAKLTAFCVFRTHNKSADNNAA